MTATNHLAAALGTGRTDRVRRPFAWTPDGREITHGEVDTLSARFAAGLQSLGVGPGDRVAVQVEKSVEALMLYLGTVRAGAVFLPLNTAYTPAEMDYFIGDAEPALVVCDPAQRDALAPIAERHGARLETLGVRAGEAPIPGSLSAHLP